jgi:hypothetical protein
MQPTKRGQIAKFHTPNEDEDSEQLYLVLEIIEDGDRTRAKMRALHTGYSFPWISVVYAKDLMIDSIVTKQLARYLEVLDIEAGFDKSALSQWDIYCIQSLKGLDL